MKQWIILILLLINTCSYAKSLNIGVLSDNPPYSTQIDKNHYYGFDITIISEICRRLNAHCNYISMNFNSLFSSLDANKIDLAIATITISPERQQEYLFSIPYLPSAAELLTNRSSPMTSIKDIENKNIGVHIGSITSALLMKAYGQRVTVIQYPNTGEVLLALKNRAVDAIVMEVGAAQYWFANSANQYKLFPPIISVGNGFGIMAKKGQGPLIAEVNKALQSMETDGTFLKTYRLYPSLIAPNSV